jgi:acylphosphatase
VNRYHIIVSGMVQGVGFRYFVYYNASSFNLTGWVRNCYDGSVEIEVQGLKEDISAFIKLIKEGNGFASIDNVSFKEIKICDSEKRFRIVG